MRKTRRRRNTGKQRLPRRSARLYKKRRKTLAKTMKKIPPKWRHSFCEPLQCSPLLTLIE